VLWLKTVFGLALSSLCFDSNEVITKGYQVCISWSSGLMPMMFITRLRLYASTRKIISGILTTVISLFSRLLTKQEKRSPAMPLITKLLLDSYGNIARTM
jgi:hypothetical protein